MTPNEQALAAELKQLITTSAEVVDNYAEHYEWCPGNDNLKCECGLAEARLNYAQRVTRGSDLLNYLKTNTQSLV